MKMKNNSLDKKLERDAFYRHTYRTINMPAHKVHFKAKVRDGEVCVEYIEEER